MCYPLANSNYFQEQGSPSSPRFCNKFLKTSGQVKEKENCSHLAGEKSAVGSALIKQQGTGILNSPLQVPNKAGSLGFAVGGVIFFRTAANGHAGDGVKKHLVRENDLSWTHILLWSELFSGHPHFCPHPVRE